MEAGAAPLITIAPNVSLNFKTKADFNVDQPPAFFGVSGIESLMRPVAEKKSKTPKSATAKGTSSWTIKWK